MTNTRPIPLFDASPLTYREEPHGSAIAQTAIGPAFHLDNRVSSVVGTMGKRQHLHEQYERLLMDSFLATCKRCHNPPSCPTDTKPVILVDLQRNQQKRANSPARWTHYVQVAAVAAIVAMRRALADDELSRPLELPDFKSVAVCRDAFYHPRHLPLQTVFPAIAGGHDQAHEEVADQPLKFSWSKTRRKIRAAAKAYSENTHADY